MPFGYTRSTPIPSGSINIWWLFFDENLKTLSSIEGQYLGPIPEMFPEYMLEFIIDPYWLLDISTFRNKKKAHKRIETLKQTFSDNPKILKTLNGTQNAIKFNKSVSKNKLIGIWSHKLGWGTVPLNTDGNGKIIFNPTYALKYHGGYNYTNVCTVFQVLRGYGTTSPWFNIKKFNNHIHK